MKRGIKFRAWNNKEKKFICSDEFDLETQLFRLHRFFVELMKLGEYDVELQQLTGLNDKNGKEVYEGDIIKFEDMEEYYQVYYTGSAFCVCNSAPMFISVLDEWSLDKAEIVGNIYENPELIEK